MDLYQAGYFRLGTQGAGAGWKVVSPSEGMSKSAREGFGGIASNLIELRQKIAINGKNGFGVFHYDNLVYIVHINYAAEGEDVRAVAYAHCFCLSLQDYYELCKEPDGLFGVPEKLFPHEYDSSVRNFPVLQELQHEHMDVASLLDKYGISDGEYVQLTRYAICALEKYTKPLCIVYDESMGSDYDVYREIMYLIISSLPFHFRIKPDLFSFGGSIASIFISTKVESDNYFDLRTHEGQCDLSKISSFKFLRIYNSISARNNLNNSRQRVLAQIANCMSDALDLPLRDIDCYSVETGYHIALGDLKKNEHLDLEEPNGEYSVELLQRFLSYPLREGEIIEKYIAYLMQRINSDALAFPDDKIMSALQNRLLKSSNESFKNEYYQMFIRKMYSMEDRKEAYSQITQLFESEQLGKEFQSFLRRYNQALYDEYILNDYIKRTVRSFESVSRFVNVYQEFVVQDNRYYKVLLVTSNNIYSRRMNQAESLKDRIEIARAAMNVPLQIARHEAEFGEYSRGIHEAFLENIKVDNFRVKDFDLYVRYRNDFLAKNNADIKWETRQGIESVYELVDMLNDPATARSKGTCVKIFVQEAVFKDPESLRHFKEDLREFIFSRITSLRPADGLDYIACTFFDSKTGIFDIKKFIQCLVKNGKASWLDESVLYDWCQRSPVISKQSRCYSALAHSAEEEVQNKAEYMSLGNKQFWQYIKNIDRALKGKTSMGDGGVMEGKEELLYSAQRIVVSIYAFLGLFIIEYGLCLAFEFDTVLKIVVMTLPPVVLIAIHVLNIFFVGGTAVSFDNTMDAVIYGGVIFIAAILAIVSGLFFFMGLSGGIVMWMLWIFGVSALLLYLLMQVVASFAMITE